MTAVTNIAHTPTPWRRGKASDAIVADVPIPEISGADDVAYYGGYLVAESVTVANQEFIVRACNAYDELLAALRDAVAALGGINSDQVPESVRTASAKAEGGAQ